jgi:hypothetical protein
MAGKLGGRASNGLLIQAGVCVVLAVMFKLDAIASIGSAVALLIFTFITAAHFRVRDQTGASALILSVAIAAAAVVLVTFIFTTLIHEPASILTLLGVFVLSIGLDYGWKRSRTGKSKPVAHQAGQGSRNDHHQAAGREGRLVHALGPGHRGPARRRAGSGSVRRAGGPAAGRVRA